MDCIIPSRLLSIWTTQIKRSQLGKTNQAKNAGCKLPKKEQGVERESCRLRPGVLREGASCHVHNNLTQQLRGFGKRYKLPRTLAAQRLSCTLGSPGSLFCYLARWKQLQKSLNLPSRGRVVPIHPGPEITWARGLSSVVGGSPPTTHQLAPCGTSTTDKKLNFLHLHQRFSNFFDHGPLFSSGIVGGPPHFRVPPLHFRNPERGSFPFPIPFPHP